MAILPTIEEQAKRVAMEPLDIEIDGKTLREWIDTVKAYRSNGWISVEDRLPDTQHIMLVCTKNRNGVPKIAMASYHDGFGWCGSGGRRGNVTHWMPLPETPKEN